LNDVRRAFREERGGGNVKGREGINDRAFREDRKFQCGGSIENAVGRQLLEDLNYPYNRNEGIYLYAQGKGRH